MLAYFYRRLNFRFFDRCTSGNNSTNKVCFGHLATVCYDKLEKQNLSFWCNCSSAGKMLLEATQLSRVHIPINDFESELT